VQVWTVNEEPDLARMLTMGVDGIVTDYPDRLLRLMGRLARLP
jgi:glycerophosphoryl diester phosphodiesterase